MSDNIPPESQRSFPPSTTTSNSFESSIPAFSSADLAHTLSRLAGAITNMALTSHAASNSPVIGNVYISENVLSEDERFKANAEQFELLLGHKYIIERMADLKDKSKTKAKDRFDLARLLVRYFFNGLPPDNTTGLDNLFLDHIISEFDVGDGVREILEKGLLSPEGRKKASARRDQVASLQWVRDRAKGQLD
ncbi:hypothetical protein NliqN6_3491 [Naganishia liquefaciens]|uniref:Uncharacterized protein n=1 Tax=Naganishia liquefaciens TaxID=104408 RepID=A0A8H3TU40_9TREE|nr:hypothetical protein NliqN6_3491 [Naganishia liquefaciens]